MIYISYEINYKIIYTIFIILLNRLAGIYTHKKAIKLLKEPYQKLPDILQDILPIIPTNIPDYVLGLCILSSIFYGTNDFNICYETLLISLTLRPFFVISTIIPTCMPKPRINVEQSFYNKIFNSTHDLIFSGHTLVFMFCGKMIEGYIGLIIQYIYPLLLISSRQHYTIDVLVSFVVYNALYSNIFYIRDIYLS